MGPHLPQDFQAIVAPAALVYSLVDDIALLMYPHGKEPSMSTASQPADRSMPLLSVIAMRITIGVCVILIVGLVVMNFQPDIGYLIVMPPFLGWFLASWGALFGVLQAEPKKKAFNVFMFSLFGPLVSILLVLLLSLIPMMF